MAARIGTAEDFDTTRVHAACLFDIVDVGALPPPMEGYALDIDDAVVQRVTLGASALALACALGGLWLVA